MVRPILGLGGGPAFAPRGRLAVATPAHVRTLRVDGTRTIHRAGLVAALVVDGGTIRSRALEPRALHGTSLEAGSVVRRLVGTWLVGTRPIGTRPVEAGTPGARVLGARRPLCSWSLEAGRFEARTLDARPLGTWALEARTFGARPLGTRALEPRALGALALGAARKRRPAPRTFGRRATSHAPWCRPLGARAEALAPILARP